MHVEDLMEAIQPYTLILKGNIMDKYLFYFILSIKRHQDKLSSLNLKEKEEDHSNIYQINKMVIL